MAIFALGGAPIGLFGITISDAQLDRVTSVRDLIDLVAVQQE
jgi:hypothetical protein